MRNQTPTSMATNFKNTNYYYISGNQTVPASAAGTGSVTTNGVTVTGVGTSFLTEMPTGSWLVDIAAGEIRKVVNTYSDTIATLSNAFTVDLGAASPKIIKSNIAEAVSISVQIPLGMADGVLENAVFPNGTAATFSKDSRDRSSARDLIDPIIVDATGTHMQVVVLY